MTTRTLLVGLLSLSLMGCGGSKKTAQTPPPPQPEWVKSRPSSPTYYYGVGASRKTTDISQYQQAARQNALADMAGEISVSISSNSVIHAFESNLNFREDFSSTIRAQAQQDLEGYEMVETYEDIDNYWVFYRLSKAQYQQLKEQRKQNAVTRSLDFFTSAMEARDRGDFRAAIVQLVKAFEPIKPYFSESLPVEFRGNQVFLGNEIFKELALIIESIDVTPTNPTLATKVGQGLSSSQLLFHIRNSRSGFLSGIPVVASYSEKPIRNNKQRTAASGAVAFEVDIVKSTKAAETFTVTLDMDDLVLEAGADPFVRRLVGRFKMPQSQVRISVEKPIFAIVSNEVVLGETVEPGNLEESFKKKAIEAGYMVKESVSEADYVVKITAVVSKRDDTGQFKNVSLEGTISVEGKAGDQLYHRPIEGFKGRHFEVKQASDEVVREAKRKLENSLFREVQEALLKRQ